MNKHIVLAMLATGVFTWNMLSQTIGPVITNGLAEPYGVAVDTNNNYYITDSANNRIVKYSGSGDVSVLAGSGDYGTEDGTGLLAAFYSPQGIAAVPAGFVVADSGNHRIRLVTLDGVTSTLAGSTAGFSNAVGVAAQFNAPAGLAADASGNVYIADQLNNAIRRLNLDTLAVDTVLATNISRPAAIALDGQGRMFIADTGNNAIKVYETNTLKLVAGSNDRAVSGSADAVIGVNALFKGPRGLLWVGGNTGLLVSDSGNGLLRRIYFNTNYNTYSVETYARSSDEGLMTPIGLAIDNQGNTIIVDLGKNALLRIPTTQVIQPPVMAPSIGVVTLVTNIFNDLTTKLTPVVNGTFFNDTVAAIRENDTNTLIHYNLEATQNRDEVPDPSSASGNTPPVYADGSPSLPDSIIGPSQIRPDITIKAIGVAAGRQPSPVVSASFRFEVAGPVIMGNNPASFALTNYTINAEMRYTTDGSDPTETSRLYVPGQKLNILNGTNDVVFRVRGFKANYHPSVVSSKTFRFADLQTSSIGVTHDFLAGIGSTIVIPVEVRLFNGDQLRTLQFRAEVASTEPGVPHVSTQFRPLNITTNDYIPVVGPQVPGTNAVFNYSSYTNADGSPGLAISFIGTNANMLVTNVATVALLAVPIPRTAFEGQRYTVSVLEPSGTSDGGQTPVLISALGPRIITVSNLSYVVGDVAVAEWYNAGDFGNGNLNNNDVNPAFYASLGIRVPFAFSDLFDAMDAYPLDTAASTGGDGQIRFLDWQITLLRSLRLTTNNWSRSWAAGGNRLSFNASLNSSPDLPAQRLTSADDGVVWSRQAIVGAAVVENAQPGQTVSVPVYLKVTHSYSVKGLQFRAMVIPDGAAPPLDQPVQFIPEGGLPSPTTLSGLQEGLPINQAAGAWSLVQNPFP
ncbi:MAG: chitobiase/beta-hexosaminidase C-terminal domain-containing protein, partial [Candidatus Omnitrophica bacterium]|nr:chitobiase/beta-hexosaminidase C-terminal domain-containing protein [Candidatus Omnitrophota bacterium]